MNIAPTDFSHTLVMVCATVVEELLPILPQGMTHRVFEFGLHVNPDRLRRTLQGAIDELNGQYHTVILGYGLCSLSIIGLKATGCRLVVPRADDCITLFLGSRSAYKAQCHREPGTFYLTKGWVEAGITPFEEIDQIVEHYGEERANRLVKAMLGNYKRLALINTGNYAIEQYRRYARKTAARFGLRYEEIPGEGSLIRKMVFGPWGEEFVVIPPGETFRYEQFF